MTIMFGGAARLIGAALAAMLLAIGAQAAEISRVTVSEEDGRTIISAKLGDEFATPTAFALDGSKRLVIDIDGARAETRSFEGAGAVTRVRTAQFDPDTARIVLDLSRAVVIAGSEASGEGGGTLEVTLGPADQAIFASLVDSGRTRLIGYTEPTRRNVARALEPGTGGAAPARAEPRLISDRRPATGLPVVIIDAGHGGRDPGSLSADGRHEKDAVLAIAKAIKRELDESGRVRAVLTRSDDTFLPLRQRSDIARQHRAQLFISVHADSFPQKPEVSGATIYTLSETASDKEAARLAHRENRSDIIAGLDLQGESDDVSNILIDLAQRETMNSSAAFAAVLQREMDNAGVPFRSHYHRFAGFLVLKAPDVPSVLLETGYMSNAEDADYLFSKRGQAEIADGVRRAVEAHFLQRLARR